MSTSILVANARARFIHQESKQYLKEKYTNMLTIAYAGGMFAITTQLISFLKQTECDIITDIYDNPVKINKLEFLEIATETYNRVMKQWLEEYTKLSSNR
jgi:hypothetical protein